MAGARDRFNWTHEFPVVSVSLLSQKEKTTLTMPLSCVESVD